MQSTSPTTEPTPEKPYDFNSEIPAAATPTPTPDTREFVMGPRQMASLAFVGVLLLGIMSAMAYFAGRKNTDQPKVTERVIERVVQAPPPVAQAPAPKPVEPPPTKPVEEKRAQATIPTFNRLYLQAGSVEVGVAEVIVEGLRQRGIAASVGVGINSKVARILVGPFNSDEEQHIAQKKIEEFGFHPFPRVFTDKDPEFQTAPATPAKP